MREPTANPRIKVIVKNNVVRFAQRFCCVDEKPAFLADMTLLVAVIDAQTNRTTDPGITQYTRGIIST